MKTYIVQPGDTLWKLAKRHGLTLDALIAANPDIGDPNKLMVGQTIHIPVLWQPPMPPMEPMPPRPPMEPRPPMPPRPPMEPMPPMPEGDMPWADALERPCIYMAHPGETLESISHKFMIALTRLLYYNLRYGRQEPLPDGARIILPEPEIQPLNPRRQVMPKRR